MLTHNLRSVFPVLMIIVLLISCTKDTNRQPYKTNDNIPQQVKVTGIENGNGKSTVFYNLPKDPDLAYVRAEYEISEGVVNTVIASKYTNKLILDGFGDTLVHSVKLISVNNNGLTSEPVSAEVKPLTPGFELAIKTLEVKATFGGFTINCKNPAGDDLAIIPMVDTANNGIWVQTIGMDNVYSSDSSISGVIHNQPSIERNYAFTIRDRWGHYSDTLYITLTPIFEEMLDKTQWQTINLPNDAKIINNGGWCYEYYMWDGVEAPGWPHVYFTEESATSSQTATIDLGAKHTFSRLKINPYLEVGGYYYVRGNPKDFEIWGSNDPDFSDPEPDILDNPTWTKIMTCHVSKPSGSPYQTETASDQELARNGWEFDFPEEFNNREFRYIRIRSLSNWQGSYFICIAEFTLWGN